MKKRLFLLFIVHCSFLIASARSSPKFEGIEWGIRAGLDMPRYRAAGFSVDNRIGWHAGIGMMFKFGAFAVGPEVSYVRHSITLDHTELGSKRIKTNSFDVPVLFSVRALPVLRIDFGPVFTVMNDCKYSDGKNNMNFGPIRPMVSYMAGLGAQLTGHCVVSFRYYGQFAPKKCVYPTGKDVRFRMSNYSLALEIGLVF